MSIEFYLEKSLEATDGRTIHSLIQDARADGTLSPTQQAIVTRSLNGRYAVLNAQAAANQKPRWP